MSHDQSQRHRVAGSVLHINRPTMRWLRKKLTKGVCEHPFELRIEGNGRVVAVAPNMAPLELDGELVRNELDRLFQADDFYWWSPRSDGSHALSVQYC